MTHTREKRLLWLGDDPFDATDWPVLSSIYHVESQRPTSALQALSPWSWDAIVLCFPALGWQRLEMFERVQKLAPATPILLFDPRASLSDAIRLARMGACQFLSDDREAATLLNEAIEANRERNLIRLADQAAPEDWEHLLIGESHEMRQVRHIIRLVGGRRATVLITGETGTGKELAARSLHLSGQRRKAPFVAVNCSALPESLLEAELFGYMKGAFTGAFQNRPGRFEDAQGGTLFLDEIADLALGLQAKLLRAVQEREVQRLGSSETICLDIRLVAATNCDLARRVEEGRFREDLYYRLNVVPLRMPALRSRRDDIPRLASHFVEKICRLEGIPRKTLASEAADSLAQHSWPGNVRQLENAVETAVAFSGDREILGVADFPLPPVIRAAPPAGIPESVVSVPDQGMDYEQTLAVIERSILDQALRKTGGNKKAAADMLGLKRTTLSAKVRSLSTLAACN